MVGHDTLRILHLSVRADDGLAHTIRPSVPSLPLSRCPLWAWNRSPVSVFHLPSVAPYLISSSYHSFNPSLAVLGHWFRRRRALAIGLTTGGSASGGVVFPIILEQLIPIVGFPWAVRIIAFILMACLTVSCLTIRTRLPLSGHISWRTAVDFRGWKDPRYALATIAAFL